jgi:hypothetical protein
MQEVKILKEQLKETGDTKQLEEQFLGDLQKIKDKKSKLESDLEEKDKEIIDLKKRIKLMRRDLQKP